jgi:hypothetical protein
VNLEEDTPHPALKISTPDEELLLADDGRTVLRHLQRQSAEIGAHSQSWLLQFLYLCRRYALRSCCDLQCQCRVDECFDIPAFP